MASASTCLNFFLRNIHPSLYELLFENPDYLDESEFEWDQLPKLASSIVRIAGIAVSLEAVYNEPNSASTPSRLRADLRRFLAGKAEGGDLYSISLLLEASKESYQSNTRILDIHAITDWRDILDARHSSILRLGNITHDLDLHKMFEELIQALPVLSCTEWNRIKRCFVIDGKTYLAFPFLISGEFDPDGLDMFAKNFRHLKTEQEITVEDVLYGNLPRRFSIGSEFPKPELKHLNEVLNSLGVEGVQGNIVHYFGKGYRHLSDLSKAIAESRNGQLGKFTLDHILNSERYKQTFSGRASSFDDDEKFLLLFLEHGPENILTKLFEDNKSIAIHLCKEFGDNLTNKCGIRGVDAWLQKADRDKEIQIEYLDSLSLSEDILESLKTRVTNEALVWGLLCAAGFSHKERINLGKPLSLRENTFHQLAFKYKKGDIAAEKIVTDGGKFLEATLRFLILFYHGLAGYYQSVKRYPSEEFPGAYERNMLDEAENKVDSKELSKPTLGKLVEIFRETIKDREVQNATNELLGRGEVCCLKTYNKLTSHLPESRNKIIHHTPWINKQDKVEQFVQSTVDLFRFFRTGSVISNSEQLFEGCVYPHVISFKESRECRSGILIRAYELEKLENSIQSDERIKILTPLKYPAADDYYCIPRTDKSSEQYWIDPFIIPCDRFDEIAEPEPTRCCETNK